MVSDLHRFSCMFSLCVFYYYGFLLLFQNALSFSRSAVADDNVLFHVCCCRLSCFVLYLLFQTHDNHFTGEKSVPTPLSCTSVPQTWTKDTGLCVYLRPSQTSCIVYSIIVFEVLVYRQTRLTLT